ncbi:MAG: S26 family signal peptidase [bacterium]
MPVLYVAGFNVNYGPSMSYLGWFYRTSWGEQPTRVGQIVRFAQPGQPTWRKYLLPSIKRVAEIRKDGYYVEGDNTEHSQDSRDWGKDISPDHVAGIVDWCWSPARAWRSRTAGGKLRNWVEFNYPPKSILWSSNKQYVAVQNGPVIRLLGSNISEQRVNGQIGRWDGESKLLFVSSEVRLYCWTPGKVWHVVSVNPQAQVITTCITGVVGEDMEAGEGTQLVMLSGDADVSDHLVVSGRSVKVLRFKRIATGEDHVIQTFVKVSR